MRFSTNNRYVLTAVLICLYFIPVLFFSVYSITQMSKNKSWSILSVGLILIAIGTLIFFLFLSYWEKVTQEKLKGGLAFEEETATREPKVTSLDPSLAYDDPLILPDVDSLSLNTGNALNTIQASLLESQEKIVFLNDQLALKENEKQAFLEQSKQWEVKAQQIGQDFSDYKLFSEEQLKQKNLQLTALQQIVEDQRAEMEKRQEQIYQLNSKIHDLSYEIKTLIHLHDAEVEAAPSFLRLDAPKGTVGVPSIAPSKVKIEISTALDNSQEELENNNAPERQIETPAEAMLLLRKCINIAQKLTGANYYSNEASRYREFSSSHYTLDQRRLFDSLRSEASALILVYSQKEHKLLFANHQTKHLLGYSSEKFVSDFSSLIQEGGADWKKAVSQLSTAAESQARLLAKTKDGQEIILNAHLGVIPTGIFRNYVIGVLYPS